MFEKIENKYRPIPFWSWNERLDAEETKRQIRLMENVGIGGFFMHARGGLQTEYMGEEWFDNVAAAVDEAKNHNMGAWAYDENGWPSGFGNGIVNGAGVDFQQKYLRCEKGEKQTDTTICNVDGYHFYYDINPFYVDTLNDAATAMFINEIYQPYYDKYKNEIEGFFTDEPQISRNGIPWSFLLPREYKKAYNDDLLLHLPELYKPTGDYKTTRFRFWRLVTNMFSKNFMKPIYDWCEAHKLKLTGHLVLEETLESQLISNGACMPHYEYFHIPGMDWLGRPIFDCLTPRQVSSVAQQLGKKQVLSETFALCGHNVGHNELKGILEWQMVNGITLLCQHLEGYSLRGIRKRDYPPAMYYQQPWWDDYKIFNDAMSRVGMIMTEGETVYDTLLIHPQSSAWICYDDDKNEGLKELNQSFLESIKELEKKHILFHLGDETIMERHARVEGDTLVIGTQRYKTVVMPFYEVLFDSTKALLDEFKANGGKLINVCDAVENNVIDCPEILYTKRVFDGFEVHYFVNNKNDSFKADISVGSKILDIKTGEVSQFSGQYTFKPFDSLVVIDDGSERIKPAESKEMQALDLSGEWEIKNCTQNSLTIDKCDYYFDGELIEKDGYVLNIQQKACDLKRPVSIRCEYKFYAEYIPQKLYLVCETPEIFDIQVNGRPVDKKLCGYFRDRQFKRLDISGYAVVGENIVTMSVDFRQSPQVYENLEKSIVFESEKNKLTYDMEFEAVYITGDFSVKCDGKYAELERNASRYSGNFVIAEPVKHIRLENIERQGFPFFAGSITVAKDFEADDVNYMLEFEKQGVNVIKVKINDSDEQIFMWEPFTADISDKLRHGKNRIEITLVNNLRNLLGPHHLEEGESYLVAPPSFYKEPCVWNGFKEIFLWNENYCFVNTGISAVKY